MNYYIAERISSDERTAWSKARADAEQIAANMGFNPICVNGTGKERKNAGTADKIRGHREMHGLWKAAFSCLKSGDTLLIQLPAVNNYLFISRLFGRLRRRGVKIIALIHDLETLRMIKDKSLTPKQKLRMRIEEISTLKKCSVLIVHNPQMKKFVKEIGIDTPCKVLGIFDYLTGAHGICTEKPAENKNTVIVAGNLDEHKSGYIYKMPDGITAELYGVNYKENDNKGLNYHGSFAAEELPRIIKGGFGLIWDGESTDTCTGAYGEYLRYNNPHKTSLYLASGFPVIIWKEAALADFVKENGVGITVSSLSEIPEKLNGITDEEYGSMCRNAAEVSKKLTDGYYLTAALKKALTGDC